ncbi:MAG: VOC family protein [Cyanobacteria bacterium SZAS TMP-1]|nr:VOC family protein [Cyanobacteria bacterium SZAS TMP-1]
MLTHFILYVKDQETSSSFYHQVLDLEPVLNVPGMTEFSLSENCVLGLMPESGIKKLLGEVLPEPSKAAGIPRAEIYLVVNDASKYLGRALQNGATLLSDLTLRDWGHKVAYCLDLDAHVLAFAEK